MPHGAFATTVFRFGKVAIPQGRAVSALDTFPLAGVSAGRDGGLCEARRTRREDASRGELRPVAPDVAAGAKHGALSHLLAGASAPNETVPKRAAPCRFLFGTVPLFQTITAGLISTTFLPLERILRFLRFQGFRQFPGRKRRKPLRIQDIPGYCRTFGSSWCRS